MIEPTYRSLVAGLLLTFIIGLLVFSMGLA